MAEGDHHHHHHHNISSVSSSSSSSASTTGSLNVLNLGKKIYFEDVGVGLPAAKTGGGSSSSSSSSASAAGAQPAGAAASSAKKGSQQPPRCQVEGCNVDLSDAKAYYSRHKVCGMHSKSPSVMVAGLQQRFCQQCSRFHQLPEFDQGKRSCRRRLAGHNERRRKPPSGSLFSSRFGRLSSSLFATDGNSRDGGFLVDFSSYPRLSGRDAWPTPRSSDRAPEMHRTGTEKYLSHPWQSSSGNPPDFLLQNSANGTSYSGPRIPPGECFTGATDASCALSLLSNKPWDSRNQASGIGMNSFMNAEGGPMAQPTVSLGAAMNQYPNTSPWGFKSGEASSNSHGMPPDLVLGQISQPLNSQYSGDLEMSQQNRRQFMELENSRAYDSDHQMHWSL